MRRTTRITLTVWCGVVATLALQAAGPCLRVETPGPVLLPDASTHQAGTLRICFQRNFSPSWSLHEIYIEGKPVGLFRARRVSPQRSPDTRPYVAFRPAEGERLILLGYGWADFPGGTGYRLEPVPVVRVKTQATASNQPAPEEGSGLILIARAE